MDTHTDDNPTSLSTGRQWQMSITVVRDEVLDAPAIGQIMSWWPFKIDVHIQAGQLEYFNRVAGCQSARDNNAGMVWASQQMVDRVDELIIDIVHGMMAAMTTYAARLDSALMVLAVLGLVVIPVMPIMSVTIVLLAMLTGRIAWLVALWRNRQLRSLLQQLADTHDQRVDQTCLVQIRHHVLNGGV